MPVLKAHMPGWKLRLLGDPAFIAPEVEEQPLERRASALFALAAIEPGISRGQAASMLWPESNGPNARQALRQQLLRMKKHTGEELIAGHAALRLGSRVSTDLEREGARGPLLGRFDYADEEELARWVERQRDARREASVQRGRRELARSEAAGESDASVRIAGQLLDLEPDNEESHRALMRAHYLAGDVARAQAAYDRLQAMLATEFNARPSAEPEQLARLLRAVEALTEQLLAEGLAGIVLDDLHYADAASVEALHTQISSERRIAFIVSCRGDELGERARAFLDGVVSTGGRRIELAALTLEEVEELLESLDLPGFDAARFAPDIARHTGGNPFFVLETVKAMLLDQSGSGVRLPVAGSVTALIERRLQRLSPGARRIARGAAVAGQEFSIELAARVLAARPLDLADAWLELEAAHVFSDGGFAHDLIFEATLASVPRALARRLHAAIAACLESSGTDPGRIGMHWEAAREPRKAGQAFVTAAAQAKAVGRKIEEAILLAHAAPCFAECKDRDTAFDALLARGQAMIYNDLGEATLASVLAAEAAARTDAQRLHALLCKAEFLGNRSDSEAAVETGRIGLRLARRSRRNDLAARFPLVIAGGLCELRRVDEALALLEPLREWAGTTLALRSRVEFLIQLGITLDLANRLTDALSAFESARAIAAAEGFKDLLATALSNLATTTSKRGRLARAVEYGRQALQLSRESELLKGTPMQTQALLAHRLRDLGHYDEAIAMLEESLAEFRRAGTRHWILATAHRLALAYAHVGQHARAMHLLAEEPTGIAVKAQAIWIAHRAEVARLAGSDAVAPIRASLALLARH